MNVELVEVMTAVGAPGSKTFTIFVTIVGGLLPSFTDNETV